MSAGIQGRLSGRDRRFAIAVSRFNEPITERLAAGARDCLREYGVRAGDITEVSVPGAWELALAAQWLARDGYAGIIALGCVIRGDTPHFEYVCMEATLGLGAVARTARIPLAFGVLTTDDIEQARARAGSGPDNKGYESAMAVLEMVSVYRQLEAD